VIKYSTLMICLLFATLCPAQDRLKGLRQEIKTLEAQAGRLDTQERSALSKLSDLERQLGLRKKLLRALETEKRRTQRAINSTQIDLNTTEQAFDRRKTAMADRMVALYKKGRLSNWEALLSLNSLHQLAVWVKYHQRILDNDQRNLSILRTQRDSILTQRRRLSAARDRQQKLISEAWQENQRMASQESRQKKLVAQYRQDKNAVRERINAKLATLREIQRQIQRQQSRPKRRDRQTFSGFAKKRGKLDWPVKGRVVKRFGTNRDALTGVEWDHPGIDIQAGEGDVVHVVAAGEVYYVDWQRSDGYIVIVDHGNGFNTVYTHLEQVQVERHDTVEPGDILGRVGNKNSLNEGTLHFQVWNKKNDVNPLRWLKKR